MHDPMTLAFEIKWPWWWMKYRPSFITIWHVDPEKDGTDDSCGWFIRGRHLGDELIERVVSRFEGDWDRTWKSDSGTVYLCGYFCPSGDPHLSVPGIVLNLFFDAAGEYFGRKGRFNRRKAVRFIQKHLFEILLFAENPTDSLYDGLTRKFEIGCGEKHTPERRKDRIRNLAGCITSWIARADRPWYRHPRWHFWHWQVNVHPIMDFKRWAFSRCEYCGRRFRWREGVCTNSWNGTGPRWFRSEPHIHHSGCNGAVVKQSPTTSPPA